MNTPKAIFSVDPGQVCGWAGLLVSPTAPLLDFGPLNFRNKRRPFRSANHALATFLARWNLCDQISPVLVVIEGQYLDHGKRKNVQSTIVLSRSAGRWEDAANDHGFGHEYIPPSTWITAELGKNLRSPQIEKLGRRKVYAMYGHQIGHEITEHECCAILIGRYVAIREWRKTVGS